MSGNFYLGAPGAMQLLPSANAAVDSTRTRGDQAVVTGDGGTTRVALLYAKGRWSVPFLSLQQADQDLVQSFYDGLFGDGPFRLVDPEYVNVLGMDVSTMGLRGAAALGWAASAGTLTRASGGPSGLATGVLTWTALSASATLMPGAVANTANTSKAPVYVAAEPFTVSVYAKASSSVAASLQLIGCDASGAIIATTTAGMSLTTAWQRFSVSIAAGASAFASAVYVLPRVVLPATGLPTSVSIAGAQAEYAAAASVWQRGYGSPSVNFVQSPGHQVATLGWADKTLTLAEA